MRARQLIGLVLAAGLTAPAVAQEKLEGRVGAGVGAAPDYEGSDDYEPIPIVPLSLRYHGFGVQTAGQGLQVDVSPWRFINFGPVVQYRGGRDDVDDPVVERLPEIDGTVEAGGFVEMNLPFFAPGRDAITLFTRATADVTGEHDGWLATPGARYSVPIGDSWRVNVILSSTWASENYIDTYFSISPAGAAAAGLPLFTADEGFKDVSGTVSASYLFTEHWGVQAVGRYKRLLGDASDSPIVEQRGSDDQFLGGVAVFYKF